ncbi:MAG: hypothetical protein C0399_11695 [Syntrophus sp. (in: bacteria)]|nr:hypothetical protein [Syntrophus sp. (in: bacteria)]
MNDLEQYFNNNTKRLIHKWQHYFEIYDRHFHAFRNKEIHLLEFGVSHGGSLQMWKQYFGEKAKIYGVDINPACKALEEEGIEIFIGSQEDRNFLQELKTKIPPVDILIDDGGHAMKQQIYTFEELYDHVRPDGIYLCEDTHTSYWKDFGGGYKRKGTFLEYSKNLIDQLYAWHSEQKNKFSVTSFTQSAFSLHFYNGIVVIEKRPMTEPFDVKTGNPVVARYRPKVPKIIKISSKLWKNLKV